MEKENITLHRDLAKFHATSSATSAPHPKTKPANAIRLPVPSPTLPPNTSSPVVNPNPHCCTVLEVDPTFYCRDEGFHQGDAPAPSTLTPANKTAIVVDNSEDTGITAKDIAVAEENLAAAKVQQIEQEQAERELTILGEVFERSLQGAGTGPDPDVQEQWDIAKATKAFLSVQPPNARVPSGPLLMTHSHLITLLAEVDQSGVTRKQPTASSDNRATATKKPRLTPLGRGTEGENGELSLKDVDALLGGGEKAEETAGQRQEQIAQVNCRPYIPHLPTTQLAGSLLSS
ncbi:hypothetical protein HDU93_000297 [Gonapodya sp. JEL0774]|nr:hypothetical protein HDU93_000297 [Gonapodya sp. JEL0774]